MSDTLLYISFLKWCLAEGELTEIQPIAERICWHDLLEFAKKQSLVGIFFRGILRLGDMKTNKPTDDDVMEWMGMAKKIEKRNKQLFQKAVFVHRTFLSEGFRNCILKGQGNALMYPDPTARTSGDIDVWVEGGDRKAIAYVKRLCPKAEICYHHIEFNRVKDVVVEVHYRPSFMNNLFYNKRLQRFFLEHAESQFTHEVRTPDGEGSFCAPTWDFNVIYQLCHISNHFFHEGVGLRQIVDYYYLLKQRTGEDKSATLSYLGLGKVGRSVMYILSHYLGLNEQSLVCPLDKKRGEILMREILEGGNFGQHDERLLSGVYKNQLMSNLQRLVRDARFALMFPSESLSEPVFRLWHFVWRKRHNRTYFK